MVGAIVGLAMGEGIHLLHEEAIIGDLWFNLGTVMNWICSFMLILGLIYLVTNAWWIRRSMTRPPRSLDELLMPELKEQARLLDDDVPDIRDQ